MPYWANIFGLRFRSKDRWKFFAVTGAPVLNFRPFRMWNTYVFPFFETVGNDLAA